MTQQQSPTWLIAAPKDGPSLSRHSLVNLQLLSGGRPVIRNLKDLCRLGNVAVQRDANCKQPFTRKSRLPIHNPVQGTVIHVGTDGQLPQRLATIPHIINPLSKRAQFLACCAHCISPYHCLTCNIAWCTILALHKLQYTIVTRCLSSTAREGQG